MSKGSGYLLYEIVDTMYDYCFPILDKIGFKLDCDRGRRCSRAQSDDVVRDISNVKQEIINYRRIVKPQRPTLRLLERQRPALRAPGPRDLLRRHRRQERAHLGPPGELQGGGGGARGHQRVGDHPPAQRHHPRADDPVGDHAAADADHGIYGMNVDVLPFAHDGAFSLRLPAAADGGDRGRADPVVPPQAVAVDRPRREPDIMWSPWRMAYVVGRARGEGPRRAALRVLRRCRRRTTTSAPTSCTVARARS